MSAADSEFDDQIVVEAGEVLGWGPFAGVAVNFEEISVERAIDNGAGSFSFRYVQTKYVPTRTEADIRIWIGANSRHSEVNGRAFDVDGRELLPIIQGRVDALRQRFDSTEHTTEMAGRDNTADLIDCSAIDRPGQWLGLKVSEIAERLAAPWKIPIVVERDVGPRIDVFKLEAGETAWSAIERACRMRGLLCFSNARGGLVIAEPGAAGRYESANADPHSPSPVGGLYEGINVVAAELEVNDQDRFSIYTVRSSKGGTNAAWASEAALIEASSFDKGVQRHRPILILSESAGTLDDAATRAQWEATVRASRARRLTVTVPGWRPWGVPNQIWEINRLVWVELPSLGISAEMLIAAVRFEHSDDGSRSVLSVVRKDAWTPEPYVPDADPLGATMPPVLEDDGEEQ